MGAVAHYSLYSRFGVNQVPLHSLVTAQGADPGVKLPGLMSAAFLSDCCTLVTPSPSPTFLWKMWPVSSTTDGLFVGWREAVLGSSACHSAYSEGARVEVCRCTREKLCNIVFLFFFLLFVFVVFGSKPRILCMSGKHLPTDLESQFLQ